MYRSMASRTTHATDTFFEAAMRSISAYCSVEKLMEARVARLVGAGRRLLCLTIPVVYLFTIVHHCGEEKPRKSLK